MKITHLTASLIMLFLLIGSCDTTSSGLDDKEPEPPVDDDPCATAALAVNQANPFDRVEITGISNLTEDFYIDYVGSAGTTGITPLFIEEGGKAVLIVPPNPDALMDGGEVTFTVTDGDLACGDLSLTVEPTEPVIGNPVVELRSAVDQLTNALAEQFNLDPAVISNTTLDALPPQAIPIAILIEAVENFDPDATLSGMSEDEAAFTNAMIEKTGMTALLDEITTSISTASTTRTTNREFQSSLIQTSENGLLNSCGDLGSVPVDQFGLDAQSLSDYIKAARGAQDNAGPFKESISTIGTAFAVVGLAAPAVGFVAGWATYTASLVQEMRANLYPSSITKLEYQLEKSRIEEDWDTSKGDPDIKWSFAKVWATNNGMGLVRAGFDFITTAVPLNPGFKGALGSVADTGFDMVAKDAINDRLDELGKDPENQSDCWGIGATEFGPVVIPDDSGDKWVRAEITVGDAISIDASDIRKITPEKIGTATLRVRTQEEAYPGPFGFQDKPVEVLRKEVVWIPSELIVENPGETKTIKFRIDNAKHNGPEDVNITPGPNLGNLPTPTFSGGVHTIELPTPTKKEDYPTWIDVASTSKSLPPDTPERQARLDIFSKETITISPRDECVGFGKREPLTATVTGPGELTVSWEIVSGAGSLSSTTGENIEYIAPTSGSSGTVTIRATLDQNQEITDEVTFRYGVCSGLALYYAMSAEIGFPFLPGGECGNPDLDDEREDFSFPEGGLDPAVDPQAGNIWINRSERFSASISDGGVFGKKPSGQETCVTDFFSADAMYDATFTGSQDGTQVDIDINTEAASIIKNMGSDIGDQDSGAGSVVFAAARFDFDIKEAAQFRFQVDLQCTGEYPAELPVPVENISAIFIQVRSDGTVREPNITTAPINVKCDNSNPALQIDRTLEFVQPEEGETEQGLVIFQVQASSYGAILNLDEVGNEIRRSASIQGFVKVEEQ